MIAGRDREESVRLTAEALGCSLAFARQVVAHEIGDPEAEDEVMVQVESGPDGPQEPASTAEPEPEG